MGYIKNKRTKSAAIELKKDQGGRVSPSQKEWQQALEMRGYKATVAKGYDEAVRVPECYLDLGGRTPIPTEVHVDLTQIVFDLNRMNFGHF